MKTPDQEKVTDKASTSAENSEKPIDAKNGKHYLCKICRENYPYITSLKIHMNKKHKENGEKCNECGKIFFSSRGIKDHMEAHIKMSQEYPVEIMEKT